MSFLQKDVISSTTAHNVAAKTGRDALSSGDGNPVFTAVSSGHHLQPSLPESSITASSWQLHNCSEEKEE